MADRIVRERVHPGRDRWLFRIDGALIRHAAGDIVYAESDRTAAEVLCRLQQDESFRPVQRPQDLGHITTERSIHSVAQA